MVMDMINKLQGTFNNPSEEFIEELANFLENAINDLRSEGYPEDAIEQAVENFIADVLLQECFK